MADAEYTGFMYAASKDASAVEALAAAGLADHCEAISFHCQQAAEKMLKCVYMEQGKVPPKTHDVGDLLASAIDEGWLKAKPEAIQAAIDLTIYAVAARYETSPDISEGEARKAIIDCNRIADMLGSNDYECIRIDLPGEPAEKEEPASIQDQEEASE